MASKFECSFFFNHFQIFSIYQGGFRLLWIQIIYTDNASHPVNLSMIKRYNFRWEMHCMGVNVSHAGKLEVLSAWTTRHSDSEIRGLSGPERDRSFPSAADRRALGVMLLVFTAVFPGHATLPGKRQALECVEGCFLICLGNIHIF